MAKCVALVDTKLSHIRQLWYVYVLMCRDESESNIEHKQI
jgi:hypothetical protein